MKISCVILNYNDASTTEEQVNRIRGYHCLDYVVIVDNGSSDDSVTRLSALTDDKVILVQAEKNGGYGAGNNLGIRYSCETLHVTHVLIANPDTEFTEDCVVSMGAVFLKQPKVGVVAASMTDHSGGNQEKAWPLRPFLKSLMAAGPVCRRTFKKVLNYPPSYFEKKKAVYVDVVHGSMLMVDARKMEDCGGYDEEVFLYEEENILGYRMKQKGYRTVLLLNQAYLHHNSVSISKTFQSISGKQKLRHDSMMYYFEHYLKINGVQKAIARLFFRVIFLEIWFCSKILKMTW